MTSSAVEKKISKEEFEEIKKLKISKNFDFFFNKVDLHCNLFLEIHDRLHVWRIGCSNDRGGMSKKIVVVFGEDRKSF